MYEHAVNTVGHVAGRPAQIPLDGPILDATIGRHARCADPRGSHNHLFFSPRPIDVARAKAICARCAVRELCLRRAIERLEPSGVWGGECLEGGKVVATPRRRGRPAGQRPAARSAGH